MAEDLMFMAVIRGGPHDGHTHLFPLKAGRPPLYLTVPGGTLRMTTWKDPKGRPIYVYVKTELLE